MPSVRLTHGKADFVTRLLPSGREQEVCLLRWNVDFSNGCIAQVYQQNLQEVQENGGKYAPGNFVKYKEEGIADGRCTYCYAWRKNSGSVAPFEVDERTRADFEEHQPKFLRVGKNTEPGHTYYRKQLLDTLELCKEFGTIPIITTKMLEFSGEDFNLIDLVEKDHPREMFEAERRDSNLVRLLKETKASVLFSLGYDHIEQGPVSMGFTNNWRINQAVEYFREGVNSNLTVVCDVTTSIKDNIFHGSAIQEALDERERSGITVRVIPVRLYTHDVARQITGNQKNILTNSGHHETLPLGLEGIDEEEHLGEPRFISKNGNVGKATAYHFHPDFRGLVDKINLGLCGAIGEKEHCDKCNCAGKTRVTFPLSELKPVTFTSPHMRTQQLKRIRNKPAKDQTLMKFEDKKPKKE